MSEELAIQLQRLYQDYYARRLEFEDYRYRRALLLDSLCDKVDEATSEDVTLPRPTEFKETETATAGSMATPAKRSAPSYRWYYVLAACVIVVIGIVFFTTRQFDEPVETPVVNSPTPAAELPAESLQPEPPPPRQEEVAIPPDVGQELVEAFVARQDWRQLSLLEFQESWSRLPEADRIVAKGAMWFEPLSESLAYKIGESRGFSADPDNDAELNALYEFSVALGLVELVPPGWKPATEDVNRGAESIAPAEPASELVVADTSANEVDEQLPDPEVTSEPAEEADDAAAAMKSVAEEEGANARPENENACSLAQLQTRRRNCFDLLASGDNGPLMRVLPAGDFAYGENGAITAISAPFAISAFEIKASEFRQYCEATGVTCPAEPWDDDDMPAVDMSWHQAVAYSEWLSMETGFRYRLPTDLEWEYAARAGTTTSYPYGDRLLPAQARYSSITNYDSPLPASDQTTQRNEFGLWHVIGNVSEWVATDGDAQGTKIVRGGSYASDEDELRSAAKQEMPANERKNTTGFRLVREL